MPPPRVSPTSYSAGLRGTEHPWADPHHLHGCDSDTATVNRYPTLVRCMREPGPLKSSRSSNESFGNQPCRQFARSTRSGLAGPGYFLAGGSRCYPRAIGAIPGRRARPHVCFRVCAAAGGWQAWLAERPATACSGCNCCNCRSRCSQAISDPEATPVATVHMNWNRQVMHDFAGVTHVSL